MRSQKWSECKARLKNRVLKGFALTDKQIALLKAATILLAEDSIAEECQKILNHNEENRQAKLN